MQFFRRAQSRPEIKNPVSHRLLRAYYLIPAPVLPAIVLVPVVSNTTSSTSKPLGASAGAGAR